jgi:tape measure domain-containing protein
MANVTTELKVVVKSVGKGEIDKLSKALNDLGSKALKPVDQKLKTSVAELAKLSTQSKQTKNNIKGFSAAFKELANNLEIGSQEFKQATAEAKKLDAQLQKLETRKPTRGARIRSAAQTAGAIAAGGVFGGPEGAIGAGIGGIIGGPAGAAVGAAIGAQVGGIRQAAGATAEYAANIAKLRVALEGVTTSQGEYSEGLDFIQQTTKDFAIPQEVVTRQFTKLQASVQGAGGNLDDTKLAFNGIVAAVRATGGSLSDVDAALTATAQVFSKGKVSAEELRQQIGERLPGAFTLFAESMGLTPQELDKALEKGQVSLQDFQKFAKAIFDRYGENAKAIAAGPESAGDRLKVQLEKLSESVGTLLRPIGAFFQNTFGQIVKDITRATNALARFLNLSFDEGKLAAAQARFEAAQSTLDSPTATKRQRQRALLSREQARKIIDQQTRLRDAGVDVQQPEAGTGLPGITPGVDKEEDADKKKNKAAQRAIGLGLAKTANLMKNLDLLREEQGLLEATLQGREKEFEVEQQIEEMTNGLPTLQAKYVEKIIRGNSELQRHVDIQKENEKQAKKQAEADPFYQMRQGLEELISVQNQVEAHALAIGNAFATSFTAVISGSKNAQEALADMMSAVAEHFLDMAAQIIAKQIAMIIYGTIMKALGVGLPSMGSGEANVGQMADMGSIGMGGSGIVENSMGQGYGTLGPNFGIRQYAQGGYVTSPTNALIGESGEPEFVIPQSKMRESMSRYSRGARGSAVIPGSSSGGMTSEAGGAATSQPIDVRYSVERINEVDYVTAEQFQAGMKRAAQQGAVEGERRALGSIRNSSAVRRRIGI